MGWTAWSQKDEGWIMRYEASGGVVFLKLQLMAQKREVLVAGINWNWMIENGICGNLGWDF